MQCKWKNSFVWDFCLVFLKMCLKGAEPRGGQFTTMVTGIISSKCFFHNTASQVISSLIDEQYSIAHDICSFFIICMHIIYISYLMICLDFVLDENKTSKGNDFYVTLILVGTNWCMFIIIIIIIMNTNKDLLSTNLYGWWQAYCYLVILKTCFVLFVLFPNKWIRLLPLGHQKQIFPAPPLSRRNQEKES